MTKSGLLTSFLFSIAILGLWFTSRVPKNPPLCSRFSHCSWISSLTRYAQSRMPWKAWWQESLSKVTPPKPSRRYAQTGQEPVWRPSRCTKRTEVGRLLHQLVSFPEQFQNFGMEYWRQMVFFTLVTWGKVSFLPYFAFHFLAVLVLVSWSQPTSNRGWVKI